MNRKIITASVVLVSLTLLSAAVQPNRADDVTNFSASSNSRNIVPVADKKKPAVKLYPNPSYNGSVTVSSNTAGKLNFYIFDLEGTMLYQAEIKEKEKYTVHNLPKGIYMYDAFLKDESIEHGKIIVK